MAQKTQNLLKEKCILVTIYNGGDTYRWCIKKATATTMSCDIVREIFESHDNEKVTMVCWYCENAVSHNHHVYKHKKVKKVMSMGEIETQIVEQMPNFVRKKEWLPELLPYCSVRRNIEQEIVDHVYVDTAVLKKRCAECEQSKFHDTHNDEYTFLPKDEIRKQIQINQGHVVLPSHPSGLGYDLLG